MSVRTMARVWAESRHGGTDLLMMLAIADFADDDGNAYPSVPTLAEKCRTTSRHANRILSGLRASGELEIRVNEGPRGTNRYRVCVGMTAASPLTPTSPRRTSPAPLTPTSSPPDVQVLKPLTPTSDEPSLNHQRTVREPSERARATRLPQPFVLPDDWRAWAQDQRPGLDINLTAETFADHWHSKGERRVDWKATWRNWVRKERGAVAPTQGRRSRQMQVMDALTGASRRQRQGSFEDVDYREGITDDGRAR